MSSSFYERYWRSHESGHLSDFEGKWPILRKFIPENERITILDFGCGCGEVLREIRKSNPVADCIGLDVSAEALTQARKNLKEAQFEQIEDGGPFPLAADSVDFIFSSEVIEHVYDTENAVRELSRVLKRGGELLLTTPFHGLIKNILIALFAFDRHFDPVGPHVRFFSDKSLRRLLSANNFEVVRSGCYGRFPPVSHSIFVLAKKC